MQAPGQNASPQSPRDVIERLFRNRSVVARSNGSLHSLSPVSITAAEGEAVREWVKREHANRTIEIGLGYGISALFICEGLIASGDAAARHLVVDPNQETGFAGCGLQFLADAGLMELVEYYAEESQIVLPRLVAEGRSFDLAFVDGNHRFDRVFLDLIYLGRLVRGGGILFVDDHQLPAVRRATSFCTTNLGWKLEEVSTDDELHHWAVLRTTLVPRERPFDYYVDF